MSIKVDFLAAGLPELERAFRSVSGRVSDIERSATTEHQRQSQRRLSTTEQVTRAQLKALETSADRGLRAVQSTTLRETQVRAQASRDRLRLLDDETRGWIRGLEDQRRAFERNLASMARAESVAVQRRGAMRAMSHGGGYGGGAGGARPALAGGGAGGVGGALGGLGLGGALGGLVGLGATAVGFVGAQASSAISAENRLQKSAIMLSNATYIPELDMGKGIKTPATPRAVPKEVMGFAKKASIETGVETEELVGAWQTYIERSSDSRAFTSKDPAERKQAQDMLITMAKIAKGSGSNLNDVMNAAGFLRVQNESMSSDDMKTTMLNVIGQGKLGAISLPDLAQNIATITSQSGNFSMGATKAQRSLMGLAQIAVQTSGTAPEAATTVSRFVAESGEAGKAKKLAALGVQVRDKTGGLKDPAEILRDLFKATGGKTEKMDAIYDVRSMRLMNALRTTYTEGVNNELAQRALAKERGEKRKDVDETTAGSEAVFKKVTRFERMGYDESDAMKDFENVMRGRSEQIDQAARELKHSFSELVVPAADSLAEAFVKGAKGLTFLLDDLTGKNAKKEDAENRAPVLKYGAGLQPLPGETPAAYRGRLQVALQESEETLKHRKENPQAAGWGKVAWKLFDGAASVIAPEAKEKSDQEYEREMKLLEETTAKLRKQFEDFNRSLAADRAAGVQRPLAGGGGPAAHASGVEDEKRMMSIPQRGGVQ